MLTPMTHANHIHSAILMICTAILVTAASAAADVTKVEVRVDGLACPFCAYGLEKKLKAMDTIENAEILLEEGLVRAKSRAGASIRLSELAHAIKDAGFAYRDGTLLATGKLIYEWGQWFLLADDAQILRLRALPAGTPTTEPVRIQARIAADQFMVDRPMLSNLRLDADGATDASAQGDDGTANKPTSGRTLLQGAHDDGGQYNKDHSREDNHE